MSSVINWKKGDYIKLGKAVSKFNQKIRQLDPNELKYLPSMINYKEIKEEILSRKELNRIVNALRRFDIAGMEVKVTLPSGQELTKWEYRELKLARNRAIKFREKQKQEVLSGNKFVGMGSEKVSQYNMSIDYMKRLETMKGYNFKEASNLIRHIGSNQYDLWKAEVYRDNFMKSLEEMSIYDGYDLLKSKLESIDNPISFFKFIQRSETLKDLFQYYKDSPTSKTYGGFASNQDAFNHALVELGITTYRKINTNQYNALKEYGAALSEFYRRF